MRRALLGLVTFCYLAQTQPVSPDTLLTDLHRESQDRPPRERMLLLWDLATAATGMDAATSAEWALEMFQLALQGGIETRSQQKNALTILSLTDPERAAQHYLELQPSPIHQPNEDPRIDCARHLFPRLWAKQGIKALPAILQFADYTSRDGQYPFIGIGHILPSLAKVDRAAAHSLTVAAIRRLGEEHGIWRTPDDFLKFLRESWPVMTAKDRRAAVGALLAFPAPDRHMLWYAEYYLPSGTVRFESEEVTRVYDLLPFVDKLDAAWGRSLRKRYPVLANAPIPRIEGAPWRSGVLANPGPNLQARVEAAFERHHLMFLAEWAKQDPQRAMAIARSTKDPARRREAIALVLPAYGKLDAELVESKATDLNFLVAMARAYFALGHTREAEQVVTQAIEIGTASADADQELHDIADIYGEFRPDDLGRLVARFQGLEPQRRLFILAGAVRGAMRHRPGYQQPS